jgi:K+/H+ antiporter YhaU regulatory subunit KhtT
MAQRKKDVRDACKFELTDEEIASLAKVLAKASKYSASIDEYRVATRWRQFFLASNVMKRGERTEVQILDKL